MTDSRVLVILLLWMTFLRLRSARSAQRKLRERRLRDSLYAISFEIRSNTVRFRVTPSSSLCTFACPHTPTKALVSSVLQPAAIIISTCDNLATWYELRVRAVRTPPTQSTLNRIETTSRSGLSSNWIETGSTQSALCVDATNAH